MIKRIVECISKACDLKPDDAQGIDKNTKLEDLGMTSIQFIDFILNLEDMFKIEIRDSDLVFERFSTISKIIDKVNEYLDNDTKKLKKCLILDCDDVLWKGISGEETIIIDNDVIEFQSKLLDLYSRGVLLCLCSRNTLSNIELAFQDALMVPSFENIVDIQASSLDKVGSIEEIAANLDLSIDSFVFVDNSAYEIGYVKNNLPDIDTVLVDYNDQFIKELMNYFNDSNMSNFNRTQQYKEQKERNKEKRRIQTIEEYNQTLETEIICDLANCKQIDRLVELSERTNQFNLSNKRYSKDQMLQLLSDKDSSVFYLSVKDKYGDMGIVGMGVLIGNLIDSFMISCRAFDRGLELVLLNKIKEVAGTELVGCYLNNNKNQRFADFYEKNGVKLKVITP